MPPVPWARTLIPACSEFLPIPPTIKASRPPSGGMRNGMKRGLALLRLGYFLIVGIILLAVLPFAIDTLHIVNTLQQQLGPAETEARHLLTAASDQESGVRGYILTEDEKYLQAYRAGTAEGR